MQEEGWAGEHGRLPLMQMILCHVRTTDTRQGKEWQPTILTRLLLTSAD